MLLELYLYFDILIKIFNIMVSALLQCSISWVISSDNVTIFSWSHHSHKSDQHCSIVYTWRVRAATKLCIVRGGRVCPPCAVRRPSCVTGWRECRTRSELPRERERERGRKREGASFLTFPASGNPRERRQRPLNVSGVSGVIDVAHCSMYSAKSLRGEVKVCVIPRPGIHFDAKASSRKVQPSIHLLLPGYWNVSNASQIKFSSHFLVS